MAEYIENIVIGIPLVLAMTLLGNTVDDMISEEYKTYFTHCRNLAVILKEIGIVSSVGEVKRNKPELCKPFDADFTDCRWIKWGKRKLYVIIGKA